MEYGRNMVDHQSAAAVDCRFGLLIQFKIYKLKFFVKIPTAVVPTRYSTGIDTGSLHTFWLAWRWAQSNQHTLSVGENDENHNSYKEK